MTKSALIFLLLLPLTMLCRADRIVTDESGRSVAVPDHPHRIICLVPNLTDTVFTLGAGNDVVAISDYVEYPPEAKKKPSVGSISNPSLETILALHPDLVLGTPHANDQSVLDQMSHMHIPVYLVDPHGIAGILQSITSVGHAIGRPGQASEVVAELKRRIAAVQSEIHGKPVVSVLMPLSYDPVITIGKGAFITEIVTLAGGHSITEDIPQEWPLISMETVVARAPEALLMMRDGRTTIASLKDRPGWSTLPAVRNSRVYYIDKRIDFPSPIAIDALEDLARQFHP